MRFTWSVNNGRMTISVCMTLGHIIVYVKISSKKIAKKKCRFHLRVKNLIEYWICATFSLHLLNSKIRDESMNLIINHRSPLFVLSTSFNGADKELWSRYGDQRRQAFNAANNDWIEQGMDAINTWRGKVEAVQILFKCKKGTGMNIRK